MYVSNIIPFREPIRSFFLARSLPLRLLDPSPVFYFCCSSYLIHPCLRWVVTARTAAPLHVNNGHYDSLIAHYFRSLLLWLDRYVSTALRLDRRLRTNRPSFLPSLLPLFLSPSPPLSLSLPFPSFASSTSSRSFSRPLLMLMLFFLSSPSLLEVGRYGKNCRPAQRK